MKKIILLIVLFSTFLVNAQWQTDTAVNTLVSGTVSGDAESISTPNGGTYIVFWKSVLAPVNYELWVQYLDANGTKMFGENGMMITNTLPMSTFTTSWKISADSKSNLYVGVTGSGAGTPGYIYKVTPAGAMPWGNGSGVNLGVGYLPTILPLSNYDVLVSYMPDAGKAKIQRFTEQGVAIWPTPIEVNSSSTYATNKTVVADMFEQSNGYFTAVFHTRTGFGVNSLLFAQRYDAAGVAQWTEPTQLADKGASYNNLSYGGVMDGDVIYYGYSLSTVSRFDAFAQRLNSDGTLPWGLNGIDFDTNLTNYEINAKIAFKPGSQYIWMVSTYTPSTQGTYGEYVQKFDKVTGARQFTDNAHQVYPIDADSRIHAGNLFMVEDKALFLLKSGNDNGVTPTTLSAQFLDSNGNFTASYVVPLATYTANKGRIVLNKPVNHKAVITFIEQKVESQSNMYAQNFSTLIDCTITAPVALADVTLPCSATLANLTAPTVTDGCGLTVTGTINSSVFPITQNTTITWTFTSGSGVIVTQTQNIIITRTMEPVALADVNSQCTVAITDLTVPVITDSCGSVVTPTTDQSIFPITQGTTVITWTYTSSTGAVATQTQNIIVNDTTAPTLVVQNVTASLGEGGTVTVAAAQFDNGSTDSCSGNTTASWTWAVSPNSFGCDDLGEQTVTITATDALGNVAVTTATVTVTDPDNHCLAGTESFNKQLVTLYPNPASDIFTINSPDAIKSLMVYDMLGKVVFSSATLATNPTVDVKLWSAGIYHVSIIDVNGNQKRFKLVRN